MAEEHQILTKTKLYQELVKKQKNLERQLKVWEEKSTQRYEMELLHKYNEIKDAAQILLGAIANLEGVTIKELHERFQLPMKD